MRNSLVKVLMAVTMMAMCGTTVSAQGFLKKLGKAAESVTEQKTDESAPADSTATESKLKEDEIPVYTCKMVYETDEQGNRLKNEDGTDKYRVLLYDKEGNVVDAEAAEAQVKQLHNAVGRFVAKVGGGAALGAGVGALSGGKKGIGKRAAVGAVAGAAAGFGLSSSDIQLYFKLNKSLKQQKECIEEYRKNFDEEGNPREANIDPTAIKELGITPDNTMETSTAEIAKELGNKITDLQNTPTIDSLLATDKDLQNS